MAGARLWISSQAKTPFGPTWELVSSATSADSGGFVLTLPPERIERAGILRDLSVLVWKEGHGAFLASWAPDEVPAGIPFEPWLQEAASTEFTVEDSSGEPYRGVRVNPTELTYPDTGGGLRIAPEISADAALFRTEGAAGAVARAEDAAGRVQGRFGTGRRRALDGALSLAPRSTPREE